MTLQTDKLTEISEIRASGGVKLGSVRYVLGSSLALAIIAGFVI